MKKIQYIIAVAAIIVIFVVSAGCTSSPNETCPVPTPVKNAIQPVSINATPVKYVEVNGAKIAYRDWGQGEPVLLLVGFGSNMDVAWNETFLGILASKYHVYTFDYPDIGFSGDYTTNVTPTIQRYSDDTAALMSALGYDSMDVYGVSMGASISQQLAFDHPERVRKLVLDSVTYSVRAPEAAGLLNSIQAVANGTLPEPPGIVKEAQANLAWNGSWDNLSGIHKDVMLVVGTADTATPQPIAAQMAGQIDGSWLVRFKDLPHVGSRFAPVEYGENALDFLGMNETPPYQFPYQP